MQLQQRPVDIVSISPAIHHLPHNMLILFLTKSHPQGMPLQPEGTVDILTTLQSAFSSSSGCVLQYKVATLV